ncbi:MAG: hybrid sensor histidine kinase/response regulator [Balneolaceae bacterium]|nr:hybrid sensor histidine kinase/response regulator [Balneolaceae bacterium]
MKEGKILIVDDMPANLQLLGMTLREVGYQVVATSKSDQVLISAEKSKPDLILLDVMMPGKNGFQVCEDLKANDELKHIPVIFLTAKVEQENINYGLLVGGVDYIAKPFNNNELLCRVNTHVSLKRSRDEIKKQREELADAVEFKNKIFSVIGHDLRTPINGISGALEMLVDLTEEHEEFDSIQAITKLSHQSSIEMGAMLEDLLNWGQLESGTFKTHLHTFNISNVLEVIEKLNSYQLSTKNITMVRDCDPELDIYSDRRILATIIRNIESNAIKFSMPGSEIHTSVKKVDDLLLISIQDFGVGMKEEIRDVMFSDGFHPKDFSTNNNGGAGIGLLICKRLASSLGAAISVESELNVGSTFTLTIPQPANISEEAEHVVVERTLN